MFKFLKEKLKSAISLFSKKVDKESEVVEEETVEKRIIPKPKKEAKKPEAKKKEAKAPEKKKEKLKKEKKAKEKVEEKPKAAEAPQKAEEIAEEKKGEAKEEKKEKVEEKKGFFGRLRERFVGKEEKPEKKAHEEAEKEAEEEIEEEKEKKGFFEKIKEVVTTKTLSEEKFESIFWELEVVLLENNVAVDVIEKIKNDLREKIVKQRFNRSDIDNIISDTLQKSISSLFDVPQIDIIKKAKQKKPYIIVFVGVNGSGKTTTIAKVAWMLQKNKLKPVIAAADTFRAAAIQQLEEHANKIGVKLIKHDYGSDPAAVAFDAIKYAESKGADVVLIDTAGRQHSNTNLMDEMKKIVRVAKPDLKVFIGESITGNDCIEQARMFNEAVNIDAIVLTKADIDEKGGAAVSVSYVTGKPIIYLGMGQEYDDLKQFDKKVIMENLGLG